MSAKQWKNNASGVYWMSADYNTQLFNFFFYQLENLAMSRFRWEGLPPLVDARYLEWVLMLQGVATIASPPGLPADNAFAMQAVLQSAPNANYNYDKWQALGQNGVKWNCDKTNGVLVWDSNMRIPITNGLALIARSLCDIVRTKQMIRLTMRNPTVMKGPKEMEQQMRSLWSQKADGEPCIIAFNNYDNIDVDTLQIESSSAPQDIAAMEADFNDVWQTGMRFLGIPSSPYKAARQTSEEVEQTSSVTDLAATSPIDARRRACEQLNALTGGDAMVYWNRDVESYTYNALNDMRNFIGDGMGTEEQ